MVRFTLKLILFCFRVATLVPLDLNIFVADLTRVPIDNVLVCVTPVRPLFLICVWNCPPYSGEIVLYAFA